ncbi:MAG TPA: AAA family ATPase, partial [Polyangiales bacterium]|nr:AAA family ATPase [Polyangiales bacterium]
MGTVYAALDSIRAKPVALKRLRLEAAPNTLELFKREFHTLRGLRHPNIIEVYDYACDAEGPFYTMELLEGGDLGKAAPLDYRVVCKYLRQIAAVLGLLHARRLLHRDISPRNIWIFPDGRLKLIDFGALSSFGVPSEVVGTLPLLAPEWLAQRGAQVDQRADLYALGALGYWLLTGQHAYPMQTSEDLARTWNRVPPAPSQWVAQAANAALPPIPNELDALILALLHPDCAARPASSEHVIDRLDAITGAAVGQVDRAVYAWLRSLAFVGRSQELQAFQARLSSRGAKGPPIAVMGEPGLGRSRLLEEFAVSATLSGAVAVSVRGEQRERAYALAEAIALGTSDQLLTEARAAAQTHAAALAQLSPELRRRLELPVQDAQLSRSQLQQALTDWLSALGAERRIVILVDDIERADEESVAWLTSLVRQIGSERVLLVVSLLELRQTAPALPLEMFGRAAQRMRLLPLTALEVRELLQLVFGGADYVARVAGVIERVARGNPAHCVELLEHLVEHDLVRYADGAWTLPGQLCEESLPRGRSELHLARFAGSSERARELGRALSIHDGSLSRAACSALSARSEPETEAALGELVLAGVLGASAQGYRFVHPEVREHALSSLSPEHCARAHARFAETLLRDVSDPIAALCAALHLWHAGQPRRSQQLVAGAVRQLLDNFERSPAAAPWLVQLVELFRGAGCGPRVLAGPLAALALASYTADPRLAKRYASEALATLEQLLHLDWARKLQRYIGPKPALYAVLAAAAAEHRTELRDLLFMLVVGVGALNGVATASFDHALGARCVRVLEPFRVLGERHIVGLIARTTRAIASITACEDHAATLAELRELAAFIASDAPIRFMPEEFRHFLLITSCFPIGILECLRMSPAALSCAERIESPESVDVVGADQLRALFYALRGDRARAAEYVQRVETRALQAGAAWQIVTLGPLDAHFTSLWTHDALLGKHAAAELERLSRELPSLQPVAARARATYLVLCGRHREAIECLRRADAPERVLGWSLGQSVLARAHNRLGEHERAREVCHEALAGRSEDDLDFVL